MSDWRSEEEERLVYRGRMSTLVRLALVALVLVVILLLWFVLSPPESRGVVYVQAPNGAVKAMPVDPGGYRAGERDATVYRLIDGNKTRVYRTQPGRRRSKEIVDHPPKGSDANHYYSIHSDVVNIYADGDDNIVEEKSHSAPCRGTVSESVRNDGLADLDLATFKTRDRALRMFQNIARDPIYTDIAKMCKDKVVIIQKNIGGNARYTVSAVDLPAYEAQKLCNHLKAHRKDCLVRRS